MSPKTSPKQECKKLNEEVPTEDSIIWLIDGREATDTKPKWKEVPQKGRVKKYLLSEPINRCLPHDNDRIEAELMIANSNCMRRVTENNSELIKPVIRIPKPGKIVSFDLHMPWINWKSWWKQAMNTLKKLMKTTIRFFLKQGVRQCSYEYQMITWLPKSQNT